MTCIAFQEVQPVKTVCPVMLNAVQTFLPYCKLSVTISLSYLVFVHIFNCVYHLIVIFPLLTYLDDLFFCTLKGINLRSTLNMKYSSFFSPCFNGLSSIIFKVDSIEDVFLFLQRFLVYMHI